VEDISLEDISLAPRKKYPHHHKQYTPMWAVLQGGQKARTLCCVVHSETVYTRKWSM